MGGVVGEAGIKKKKGHNVDEICSEGVTKRLKDGMACVPQCGGYI